MEQHLVILLVKLAVAASLASILVRWGAFQRMLMREQRTLQQRVMLALSLSGIVAAGVAIRVVTNSYQAVDLGLEGSLLAGILGGYVAGLLSGVVIAIPALAHQEYLAMPLLAGVGVLGGLLRDLAPEPEEIWRFSPFFDLSLWRLVRGKADFSRTAFQIFCLLSILFAEFLRLVLAHLFGPKMIFTLYPAWSNPNPLSVIAVFATTVFAVTLPLKIWNNTRNERKLESQGRLLTEARLEALSKQINPHFLFNTLNSIASLVRTNPEQARKVIYRLSAILRRLLRQHDSYNPMREELQFIDDYLAIEMVRFGEKLKFQKEVEPPVLDYLVPSMLLQPLVENSIRHGLSKKLDGGTIHLRCRVEGARLHVCVEDDGVGIPEAKLAKLFEQGIGVSNVNERLKVLYGNNYRMTIDSRPGEGTRTEIDIPAMQTTLAAVS
ncbi:MAG TPA: sensor histidine kinase [Solibacterales bacterium]|nr:sensor histidine kinase [Bryobacterales bacterium]